MKEIAKTVADFYKVDYDSIFSNSRNRDLVRVRQMAMYIGRTYYNLTHYEVAGFFKKDHATSIHAVKTVNNETRFSLKKRKELREIRTILYEASFGKQKPETPFFCINTPYEIRHIKAC